MKKRYDVIVIGGGHNGLTAAAYLAKAGKKVLVLEKRPCLGGAAATEELWPGFQVNTGADDAALFQDNIVKDLFLKMNGLEFREAKTAIFAPQPAGEGLTLYPDVERSTAEIAKLSRQDAARYPAFVEQIELFTAVLREMLLQTPPNLNERSLNEIVSWGNVGLKLRRQGGQAMMEFMRILPMPAREYLDEWFESDLLKGSLGLDAVTGTMQGPWSAGTALQFLYQNINGFLKRRTVLGGTGALSAALANAAKQYGTEIRTEAGVAKIQVDNGRALAVLLENGDQIPANVILSNADPQRTLLGLVGPQKLEPHFMRALRNIIYRGSTARLILALEGLPQFAGQTMEEQLAGRIRLASSLAAIEKAYDAAKHGRISGQPVLDMTIPTLTDSTLAPSGRHILSVTVRYAPYHLATEEWPTVAITLVEDILNTLNSIAPDLKQQILQQHFISPLDYEQIYNLTEGSIFHGQMSLDQLLVMRPVPAWGQYCTPIENLYLCGAGTHPGGGVTGAPGFNAAQTVLARLK